MSIIWSVIELLALSFFKLFIIKLVPSLDSHLGIKSYSTINPKELLLILIVSISSISESLSSCFISYSSSISIFLVSSGSSFLIGVIFLMFLTSKVGFKKEGVIFSKLLFILLIVLNLLETLLRV